MSLALHGHHALLIATLAFAAAVLTPNWFTNTNNTSSPAYGTKINVFQICLNSSILPDCSWILSPILNGSIPREVKLLYPTLAASFAIACAGFSLIALLLGSWYIKQHTSDNDSKCLLISTILTTFLAFLLSCGVWSVMLTANLQHDFGTRNILLGELGFSFWINIGSSGAYLYSLFIYLIAICVN